MKILWIIILVADNLLPLLLARFYPRYEKQKKRELHDSVPLSSVFIASVSHL